MVFVKSNLEISISIFFIMISINIDEPTQK